MVNSRPRSPAKVRHLGLLVRAHREAAGHSIDSLAKQLGMSSSSLHRFETGQGWPNNWDLTDGMTRILAILGVHGQELRQTMEAVEAAKQPNWLAVGAGFSQQFATLVDYEEAASMITSVDTCVFPGLMQTRAYAEAVFATSDLSLAEQRERVAIRLRRQHILDTVHLTALLAESVLTTEVGTVQVMIDQLTFVNTLADRGNITIRILPHSQACLTASGGYVLLEFVDQPPVAYADNAFGGTLLDQSDRVEHLMRSTDRLINASLAPARSVELLRDTLSQLQSKDWSVRDRSDRMA
jgi:DNA-binding transcriptional regulator YiaG